MHLWAWLIVWLAGSWAVALLVGRWFATRPSAPIRDREDG